MTVDKNVFYFDVSKQRRRVPIIDFDRVCSITICNQYIVLQVYNIINGLQQCLNKKIKAVVPQTTRL